MILLSISVGLVAISPKTKIPYPIFLLVGGIIVGLIPGFQRISIDSEIVLLIFLPPLLYDAATNISFKKFKENLNVISFLSISLVFATMFGIAIFVYMCIPQMSWPLAFLLGAILSPPDAVAALGITGDLGLSRRLKTIIEGEGLINDASALIACRFALAAVAGVPFVFWEAYIAFFFVLGGGIIVGAGLWYVFRIIAQKLDSNNRAMISLNLLLPFIAFLIGEGLEVSGILAVSTVGLLMSKNSDQIWGNHKRIMADSKILWASLTSMLNGLVFILLGIEFPHVIKQIPGNLLLWLTFCSFLIFAVALAVRAVVLSVYKINLDRSYPRFKKGETYFEKFGRIKLSLDPLSWKDLIVISCSGMRGIVSLAIALAIPVTLADGRLFPERDMIIFLTITVVILMLIIQGLGLYPLLRFLKLDYEAEHDQTTPEQ
jgi:CPA1 family monovalent cation:H+ antiporter